MYDILDRITKGQGTMEDIDRMETIGFAMQRASLCGLGQTAPNPIMSSLRYFKDEYIAHIQDKTCPSGHCKELVTYYILPDKCIGCTLCARNCPVNCIEGERKKTHVIDQDRCIKCGMCYQVCKFDAVTRQ